MRLAFLLVLLAAAAVDAQRPPRDVTADSRFNAVTWIQNSAEYRLAARQAYRLATLQLEKGLADRSWTADLVQRAAGGYQDKPPAIILDVDETVLNNSAYSARGILQNTKYRLATWNDWVREERARPVPGALAFIKQAASKGVGVFYVTNRRDQVSKATVNNLIKLGFPVSASHVLTRNDKQGRGPDKTTRRAMVASRHRIILLVGDNLADFSAGMNTTKQDDRNTLAAKNEALLGARWILLPNPVYGGWERALGKPRDALRTSRK